MTSYYKYLPTKRTHCSKFSLRKRQIRQYVFVVLLFLTIIFLTLYEFYFTMTERSKNGIAEASVLEAIICQVFMLTTCPKKDNTKLLQLRETFGQLNKAQVIRNSEELEVTDETIIIVIQVHKRADYLQELIKSLSSVKDINSTIIIFSHDFFCEEINSMVRSIDFAPVMQMFFPFSIQLYPNEFPGTDPKDCRWDLDVEKARAQQCLGANTPDANKHFRQGEMTQTKHHWWWKINRIFNHLTITNNFDGFVLFLEEDHYVAPDILHTLRLMIHLASTECLECNSFHLGNFKTCHDYSESSEIVDIIPGNNMGFAFNRSVWNALSACSNVFCTFDDYNWDWSLRYTAQECFFQKIVPLVVRCTRVFHIGDCGMHHKTDDCGTKEKLNEAQDIIESVKPFLFPENLKIEERNPQQPHIKKGWGGWADPRDIQLCMNMSSPRTILLNT